MFTAHRLTLQLYPAYAGRSLHAAAALRLTPQFACIIKPMRWLTAALSFVVWFLILHFPIHLYLRETPIWPVSYIVPTLVAGLSAYRAIRRPATRSFQLQRKGD